MQRTLLPRLGRAEMGRSSGPHGRSVWRLLERLDGRGVPDVSAGAGPTVVVTMSLERLMGGLAAATLDTGDRIEGALPPGHWSSR